MSVIKKFGEHTTALEIVGDVDLTGFEVIITGANSGIGVETLRALAKAGARCVVTARDIPRAKEVVDELIKSTGNSNIVVGNPTATGSFHSKTMLITQVPFTCLQSFPL